MARHRSRSAQRRSARTRHSVRLSTLRRAGRGHDGQRHHLSRPLRRARSRQGLGFDAETLDRLSALVGTWEWQRSRRTRWSGTSAMPASTLAHPRIAQIPASFACASRICRATSASIPAAWSSARDGLIPWSRSNPPPCPAASSCNGTKKIAPTCGIVKVDLLGLGMMAVLEDTIPLIRDQLSAKKSTSPNFRQTTPTSTPHCRRPTPSACSRSRAARRCRACRACVPTRFYDHRRAGRHHSPRPDRRARWSIHISNRRQGREDSRVSASLAGTRAQANPGRTSLSGTTPAHGHDRRRLHRRRSRRIAPGNGLQALGEAHARDRSKAARRHGRKTASPAGSAGTDHAVDHLICALRIPRIARGQLRPASLMPAPI